MIKKEEKKIEKEIKRQLGKKKKTF